MKYFTENGKKKEALALSEKIKLVQGIQSKAANYLSQNQNQNQNQNKD